MMMIYNDKPRVSMRLIEALKHPAAKKGNPEAGDTGTIPSIVQSNALAWLENHTGYSLQRSLTWNVTTVIRHN